MASNYKIHLNPRPGQPTHLAIRNMIRLFTRNTGTVIREATRRQHFESPAEVRRRKLAKARAEEKRLAKLNPFSKYW